MRSWLEKNDIEIMHSADNGKNMLLWKDLLEP